MNPFIYALVDPLEPDHIRYIGLATRTDRPYVHADEALRSDVTTHKLTWIRKLLINKRMYSVNILEELLNNISREDLCNAEKRHIAEKKSLGHDLTNATDGGDGKLDWSEEERGEVSVRSKEWWANPDNYSSHIEKVKLNLTKAWGNPEVYQKHVLGSKRMWENPEHREKVTAWRQDPVRCEEHRINTSIASQKRWNDPEYHARMCEIQKEGYKNIERRIKQSKSSSKRVGISLEEQISRTKVRIRETKLFARNNPNKLDIALKMIDHHNQILKELQAQVENVCSN